MIPYIFNLLIKMNDSIYAKLAVTGTATPVAAWVFSHTTLNMWLQTGSLVIGCAVGIASLVAMYFKWKQK